MKGLANLIDITTPSIVAIQSGVLVTFMLCFGVVMIRIYGSKQKAFTEELGRRALED